LQSTVTPAEEKRREQWVRFERVASSRRAVTSGTQILPPDEEEAHLKTEKILERKKIVVDRDRA
jgi:hypothetical protein